MATPIILRGGGFSDAFSEALMQTFLQERQLQLQRDQQKLQEREIALRERAQQMERAPAQQQVAGLLQALAAGDSMAQQVAAQLPGFAEAANALGSAQVSSAAANTGIEAFGTRPSPASPSPIEAAQTSVQQEAQMNRFLNQLKRHLTPEEFSAFEAAIHLEQLGVPKEMVDFAIPETAREKAERLKVMAELEQMGDERLSNQKAFEYLRDRYGIELGGPAGAQKVLADMLLEDRKFAQAMALKAAGREDDLRKLEVQMRNDFEQSQVTKLSQSLIYSFGRILKLASKPKPTGADDTAIVFAFINMQDQTAARDAERRELRQAGSIEQRISAIVGRWERGTVLSDAQRQAIVDAAQAMLEAQQVAQQSYTDWVTKNAQAAGLDPSRITYDVFGDAMKRFEDDLARMRMNRAFRGAR